jgi:hypothetical protein
MSHDHYVALGRAELEENSRKVRPPNMAHPQTSNTNKENKVQRELCWPFQCCWSSKRNQSFTNNDDQSLLEAVPQRALAIKGPIDEGTRTTFVSQNKNIKAEQSDIFPPSKNQEEEVDDEENYPGSDLQNAIALSLQVCCVRSAYQLRIPPPPLPTNIFDERVCFAMFLCLGGRYWR